MDFDKINLEELRSELTKHPDEWVAVSVDNAVVGAGSTYTEAVEDAKTSHKDFIVVKVPAFDATLAPHNT